MDDLKILSMNCRGLSEQKKRRDVMNYLRNLNFNILFLQDTHMIEKTLPYFNNLWKGKCYHAYHSSRSRGTCILFSRNTQHTVIKEISSSCGNYVIVICQIISETFAFVSTYGPNEDKPDFFRKLFAHFSDIEVDHLIIGGDLNFIMDPETDALHYRKENNVNARKQFNRLANENNLVDVWRQINPNERKYTWTRQNPFKCSRLDMFFISEHLINRVTEADIIPGYKTDHNIITLKIKTQQEPRGNGLWMFNTSHLLNDEYINQIRTCVQETLKQYLRSTSV